MRFVLFALSLLVASPAAANNPEEGQEQQLQALLSSAAEQAAPFVGPLARAFCTPWLGVCPTANKPAAPVASTKAPPLQEVIASGNAPEKQAEPPPAVKASRHPAPTDAPSGWKTAGDWMFYGGLGLAAASGVAKVLLSGKIDEENAAYGRKVQALCPNNACPTEEARTAVRAKRNSLQSSRSWSAVNNTVLAGAAIVAATGAVLKFSF